MKPPPNALREDKAPRSAADASEEAVRDRARNRGVKLGIVTICLDQARFLEECIQSVALKKSSPDNLSYVIVDPGSTDGSRDIVERHRDRFHACIIEPDEGPADGLNKGFAACKADVYGFINADDYYLPGALDTACETFRLHPETDILFGRTIVVDEHGRAGGRVLGPHNFSLRDYLDRCCTFAQQAMFFRADLFHEAGGFEVRNRSCWDVELMVDMLLARTEARIRNIGQTLGAFRLYPGSISGSQRHRGLYLDDRRRIENKILAAGVTGSPPWRRILKQLRFRAQQAALRTRDGRSS